MKLYTYTSLFILVLFLCQCSATRKLIVRNYPSVEDHKIFHADTLKASNDCDKTSLPIAKNFSIPDFNSWAAFKKDSHIKNGFDEFLKETATTAFIIVRNDSILYENYANGYTKANKPIIFSISKVFTTSLVHIAIQEGHIKSIHQKVCDFLPAFKLKGRDKITINDLLNMTSGLNHDDYNKIMRTGIAYYHSNLDKLVDKTPMKHKAGKRFVYKSLETEVLGLCLEKATGIGFTEYMQTRIWNKLDMCSDALITLDKKGGNERMFGGMAMMPKDLIKIGQLFLNNGLYNGEQILSKEWVKDIQHRRNYKKWWGYRNGWWRDVFSSPTSLTAGTDYYASGLWGQSLYINPKTNTIIIRLGKNYGNVVWPASIPQLNKLINNMPVRNTLQEHDLDGVYQCKDGQQMTLKRHKKGHWKMKYQSKTLKMKAYCFNSLYNQKHFTRLAFITNDEGLKGCYFDDGQGTTLFFDKIL